MTILIAGFYVCKRLEEFITSNLNMIVLTRLHEIPQFTIHVTAHSKVTKLCCHFCFNH